jgi:FkbM family methyltransferase
MSQIERYRRALSARWLAVRLGLTGRQHQYGEISALRRFIAHFDIDCILDIGANAGQYGTMLRQDVGFKGTILSFEPNPDVFAKLKQLANSDANWHCYDIALTDHDGETVFNIMAADQFSSINAPNSDLQSIFASSNKVVKSVPVICRRLDSLFPELEHARNAKSILLKMDTQGHDAAVCTGAGDLLQKMSGAQSELAVRQLYAGATDWKDMIALLEKAGFVPSALFANNKGHFPLLFEIDGLFARADLTKDGNITVA